MGKPDKSKQYRNSKKTRARQKIPYVTRLLNQKTH